MNPAASGEPSPGAGGPGERSHSLPAAVRLVGKLTAAGLVTWFLLRSIGFDLHGLKEYPLGDLELAWGSLGGASLVLGLSYLYAAALWGMLVREMSAFELPLAVSLRIFFTANLGRYLPGKLWQLAGLALLAREAGVGGAAATGSALLGQAFSLGGAAAVGAGVFLGSSSVVGGGLEWVAVLVPVGLVLLTFPAVLRRVIGLWFRLARSPAPAAFRPDSAFGLRWLVLYGIGWVGQGCAFALLVRGLGMEVGVTQGATTYAAAYLLGYLAVFAPAGLGVREAFLILFLQPVLGVGAGLAAVAARLWTTLVEVALALGCLAFAGPRPAGDGRSARGGRAGE